MNVEGTYRRRRRIICSDDSGAARRYLRSDPSLSRGTKGWLADRFAHCVGTQVDSYSWCVSDDDGCLQGNGAWGRLGDVNQVTLEACRKAGMEVFATLRMNDTHDAITGIKKASKKTHPEWLVGRRGEYPRDSIKYFSWSAYDYAREEVCTYRWRLAEQVCRAYDWDGLELDFSRHPVFFRLGEEERHARAMTTFVCRIREMLDRIGAEHGKPLLVSALVPETPALAMKIGLDVESWLKRGLVDLLAAGWGYRPYSQKVEELIEVGHGYGVPVYPNVNGSCLMDRGGHWIERLRGMASNFFAKGADGVYLFNMFVPVQHPVDGKVVEPEELYPSINEIGGPETLKGKDKLFGVIAASKHPPCAYSSTRSALPFSMVEGAPLDFFVGDDVEAESERGNVRDVRLIARLTGIEEDEGIAALVNGRPGEKVSRRRTEQPFVNQYAPYWGEEKGGMSSSGVWSHAPSGKARTESPSSPGATVQKASPRAFRRSGCE